MAAGLAKLVELKKRLLPDSLEGQVSFDTVVQQVGLGVAAQFDRHANRLLARVAAEQDVFSADRDHWILRRYPLESISAISQRDDLATGWVALVVADVVAQQREQSGLIEFATRLGWRRSLLRLTYTGGYWFDTAE